MATRRHALQASVRCGCVRRKLSAYTRLSRPMNVRPAARLSAARPARLRAAEWFQVEAASHGELLRRHAGEVPPTEGSVQPPGPEYGLDVRRPPRLPDRPPRARRFTASISATKASCAATRSLGAASATVSARASTNIARKPSRNAMAVAASGGSSPSMSIDARRTSVAAFDRAPTSARPAKYAAALELSGRLSIAGTPSISSIVHGASNPNAWLNSVSQVPSSIRPSRTSSTSSRNAALAVHSAQGSSNETWIVVRSSRPRGGGEQIAPGQPVDLPRVEQI